MLDSVFYRAMHVRAGNGSLELTHDPLTHLICGPWPMRYDPWPITFNVGNVDKHTTPKSIIPLCMWTISAWTQHTSQTSIWYYALEKLSFKQLWVFCVIRLQLPSLVQRVIHWYGILPLLNDEISLSTNFQVSIYCELLSIFYCDLLGWWNNGGSNGSLFWMGHVGHGSVHVDPWPTIDPLPALMHVVLARCCYRKLSVWLSVCLSVRLSVRDVDVSWTYVLG